MIAAALILSLILVLLVHTDSKLHFNESTFKELEMRGIAYYNKQKEERAMRHIAEDIDKIHPNFPCV